MEDKEEQKIKEKLLEQLHEQYAVNNNANQGSIITLVISLAAVIGYYGYMYVNSSVVFSRCFNYLYDTCHEVYYFDALVLTFISSFIVLCFLACICIYQGVAQRKEQFIIDAIRRQNFGSDLNKDGKIFPKDYHPFNKTGLDIVQGLYGEMVKVIIILLIVLFVSFLLKVFASFHETTCCKCCGSCCCCRNCIAYIELIICFICIIVSICISFYYYNKQVFSYIKRQSEYLSIAPVESNDLPQYMKDDLTKV